MVVTHNDTLHVEMSRSCYEEVLPHIQHPWSLLKANEGETENLIIMCTDATFLLDRTLLSSVSDTVSREEDYLHEYRRLTRRFFFLTGLSAVLITRNFELLLETKCPE